MGIAQFEGRALVFNNGVIDVRQGDTSLVDSEKVAHIPESNVAIDNETIIRNANNQLEVPIDEDTIYMDDHGFMKAKVGEGKTYTAGEHIEISSEGVISANIPEMQDELTIIKNSEGKLETSIGGAYEKNKLFPARTFIFDGGFEWGQIPDSSNYGFIYKGTSPTDGELTAYNTYKYGDNLDTNVPISLRVDYHDENGNQQSVVLDATKGKTGWSPGWTYLDSVKRIRIVGMYGPITAQFMSVTNPTPPITSIEKIEITYPEYTRTVIEQIHSAAVIPLDSNGLKLDNGNKYLEIDYNFVQPKLIAGNNITITDGGWKDTISATVPTKVSELQNDLHFVTSEDVPEVLEYTGGNDIEVTSEGVINYTGSQTVEVGYPDNGEVMANGTFAYHEPTSTGASWLGTVDASVEPDAVDFGTVLFGWSDEWPHPWTERVMNQNSPVELVARTANNSRSFKVISASGYADGQDNSVTLILEPEFEHYLSWELTIYDNSFNLYTEETETFTDNITQFRLNYADTSTLKQLQNGHLVNDPADLSDINNSINSINNSINRIDDELITKQDTLTAGQNITIQNNVISATGGVTIQHYPNAVINIPCNVETHKESSWEITLTQEQYNSIITACGGANVKRHNTAGGSYMPNDDYAWFDSESDCYIDITFTGDYDVLFPITAMGMLNMSYYDGESEEPTIGPVFVFQEKYDWGPGSMAGPCLTHPGPNSYKFVMEGNEDPGTVTNVKFVLRDIPTIVL